MNVNSILESNPFRYSIGENDQKNDKKQFEKASNLAAQHTDSEKFSTEAVKLESSNPQTDDSNATQFQHKYQFDEFVRQGEKQEPSISGVYNALKVDKGTADITSGKEDTQLTQTTDATEKLHLSEDDQLLELAKGKIGDEEKNNDEDEKGKGRGTLGSLEKNCRREGPNRTCNHRDDTPGRYTETPL